MSDPSPLKTSSLFWEKLLTDPLPVVGRWGQRIAINHLKSTADKGDPDTIPILACGLTDPKIAAYQSEIADFLAGSLPAACHDRLWEEWAAKRLPALEMILVGKKKQAGFHSSAWVLSLAKLEKIDALQDIRPDKVADLLNLHLDSDPVVAGSARSALTNLSRQESRDEFYRIWSITRSEDTWQLARNSGYVSYEPIEVRVLYLLKISEVNELIHCNSEMIPGLVTALNDSDQTISSQARAILPRLQKETAINALCQHWQQSRSPLLAEIIREGQMLATRPIELRLMTALVSGRNQTARQIRAEGIPHLFNITQDRDVQLAQAAREALLSLENPDAQTALCMLAVNQNQPQAFELALSAGYRPAKPEQSALFLFLAGLWAEYDTLDFDNRLMQAAYEIGQTTLRQRIANQVQRSRKSSYLSILAGFDPRANMARLSPEEIRLLVELLIDNKEWPRLWALVNLVPFRWSIRMLQALQGASWYPENPSDCEDFNRMIHLADGLPLPTLHDWERLLPAAISVATVRVSGRVNDLSFAPDSALIAIGTGNRKLVLWDFQKAEIQRIRQGFNHSIARVAFVGSEFLVCGVRSNADAACWLYGWQNEDAFVLPGHQGAVTAILPEGERYLVSTGRDGKVIRWDLSQRSEIARQDLPDWPRAAFVSHPQHKIVLMHSSLSMMRLPDLANNDPQSIRTIALTGTKVSMATCGVFTPDSDMFFVGQRNGQVVRYRSKPENCSLVRDVILEKNSSVVDMAFLPSQPILVIATANGRIEFRRWPDLADVGAISTATGRLTSMHISTNGAFMACGTDESSVQLWDLRIRDLPALLELPLATAHPDQLAAITGLLRTSTILETFRQTLQLAEALLQRRFRFDIQVDDLHQIQPGEFDIIIE